LRGEGEEEERGEGRTRADRRGRGGWKKVNVDKHGGKGW
jgi:hypothetical protein